MFVQRNSIWKQIVIIMKDELIEGVDFYYNKNGYMVFMAKYHLDRGYCCGIGCKHCPFHYESVPEPLRSRLQEEDRKDGKA